ncbi:MAG: isochorismatase family cysteine hydrolase [Methanomassiliicoccales archaeon]|nr:isochorismatase family cysteine hydrolase [Methanomassiliicoccales archaeon]
MIALRRAVIVVDMINDFVYGKFGSERARGIIPAISRLLETARAKGYLVIFTRDAHESKDPEMKIWGEHAMKGTSGSEVIQDLKIHKGDHVIEKTTYSSFYNTELDSVLRRHNVDEVIIVGVTTDICVRHTAADAFFRGYKIIIPKECVQTISDEVQERALDEMKRLYRAEIWDLDRVIS